MNKRLPNIFKGTVKKSSNQVNSVIEKDKPIIHDKEEIVSVKKQIKDIFTSTSFIYKADTLIKLNTGETIKKTIIGKNNNSLITMDDELIDISSIVNIELI